MVKHDLKLWPEYFAPMQSGLKTFDLRSTENRHFDVGDMIRFREYDQNKGATGRTLYRYIAYILESGEDLPRRGLRRGYCILGLTSITKTRWATATMAPPSVLSV